MNSLEACVLFAAIIMAGVVIYKSFWQIEYGLTIAGHKILDWIMDFLGWLARNPLKHKCEFLVWQLEDEKITVKECKKCGKTTWFDENGKEI